MPKFFTHIIGTIKDSHGTFRVLALIERKLDGSWKELARRKEAV